MWLKSVIPCQCQIDRLPLAESSSLDLYLPTPKLWYNHGVTHFYISAPYAFRSLIISVLQEIFYDNLKEFVWKPLDRDWVARVVFPIQFLLIFGNRCNRSLCTIYRYLILICSFNSFQQNFPKANYFRAYRKLQWSRDQLLQRPILIQ